MWVESSRDHEGRVVVASDLLTPSPGVIIRSQHQLEEAVLEYSTSNNMTKAQALSSAALSEGWQFKQADDADENAWLSVKKVPTNVHLDLIEHGK